ncbi:MAG: hypothetical protein KDM63_03435, partial [Verrucomicrobiae bacterium]|nr:hypothetical protein [Verrucomicrobiae bacterium]
MRSKVGVSLTGACLWLVAAGIPFISVSGFGADLVEPSRLREVVKKAAPGAVILVKDGTYVDQVIEIEGKGEETQPIVIRSETPGGVIFTGKSGIELKGTGLV